VLLKPIALGVEIAGEHLAERVRRVETRDLSRPIQLVANILKPEHLAIRGVQERNVIPTEVEAACVNAFRISFGLPENVLRSEGDLLRFDDAQQLTIDDERVIRRTICGRVLLDRMALVLGKCTIRVERHDLPSPRPELGVDSRFPSATL